MSDELPQPPDALLEVFARAEDPDVDLFEAALACARITYRNVDTEAYRQRLARFGALVRARIRHGADAVHRWERLCEVFHEELGFRGNEANYHDPRNSYLNRVMDRRLGIPITLSVVYMSLARYADLEMEGVGFPGHFLVRLVGPDVANPVYLDPFNGGTVVDREQLRQRVVAMGNDDATVRRYLPALLAPVSKRALLVRMLRNLKAIYRRTGDGVRGLSVADHILTVAPDLAEEWRDRALLYRELECFVAARDDLRRYLELAPDADDGPRMAEVLAELEIRARRLG